jgi:uncharacterized membrane protein
MADFSSMLAFAPELLKGMPVIFQAVQAVAYVFFILFFGSIIIRDFRGYLPWYMKLLARIGFGFIALICSVALAPLIPISGTGIFNLIFILVQLNLWIAGIISTVVLTLSLFLISNKIYNMRGMERAMEKLKLRMEKAKSVEKEMAGKSIVQRILQPLTLAGIVIFAGFIVIALVNFRGFPNPTDNVLSAIGLNQSDLDKLSGLIESVSPGQNQTPPGCASPIELIQSLNTSSVNELTSVIGQLPLYTDSGTKSLIESGSHETVFQIYKVTYNQRAYALAITTSQSVCSATGTQFCGCINFGSP